MYHAFNIMLYHLYSCSLRPYSSENTQTSGADRCSAIACSRKKCRKTSRRGGSAPQGIADDFQPLGSGSCWFSSVRKCEIFCPVGWEDTRLADCYYETIECNKIVHHRKWNNESKFNKPDWYLEESLHLLCHATSLTFHMQALGWKPDRNLCTCYAKQRCQLYKCKPSFENQIENF